MSDEFHNLDNLESRLNKPKLKDFGLHTHVLKRESGESEKEIPLSWGNQGKTDLPTVVEEPSMSFGLKLFIGSLFLLLSVLGYTGYRVYSSNNTVSNANIDVMVSLSPYIVGGEITPMSIEVGNRNNISLQEAVLSISYKKGISSQNETEEISEKRDIGLMNKSGVAKQEFKVQIYGAEAESKDINVKLEYKVAGSNAIFSKIVTVSTVIKSAAVSVHINGPDSLIQGQSGSYTFDIKNNTSVKTDPFLVSLAMPISFKIDEVFPKQEGKDFIWKINNLNPNETISIVIKGVFISNAGEKTSIHATVGASTGNSNNISTVYSSDVKDVLINKSPINLSMSLTTGVGNVEVGILKYGDKPKATITYENISDEILYNVELTVYVSGDAPIVNSISGDSNGYIDTLNKKIVYNKNTLPALASLQPKSKGSAILYIPIITKGGNSPNLHLEITGTGDSSSPLGVSTRISKDWLVEGVAKLNSQTTYQNSPFPNSGPVPPKANTETTYTLHLNSSAQNSLSAVKVSFVLPFYVTWKNVFTSGAPVSYDSGNKTVTWNVGKLDSGQTANTDIQVSVRPSVSHIGNSPVITSPIIMEGTETDSNSTIKISNPPLTTEMFGKEWKLDIGTVVAQ